MNKQKKHAGEFAATLIEDGMVVGLGTGSTIAYFLDALAKRIQDEKMTIIGVTTSTKTARRADEVDQHLNGIKGGGASFLMEKIVARYSRLVIWIIDEQKLHNKLGQFPLPVEVVAFGSGKLIAELKKRHLHPKLRLDNHQQPLVTDLGHYIVDLDLEKIDQPFELGHYLDGQIGIVEHGLFLNVADQVIIGSIAMNEDVVYQMEQTAEKAINESFDYAKSLGHNDVDIHVRFGSPKRVIARDFPKDHHNDLIVIGETGLSRLQRAMAGTVPSFVTQVSKVDVLIMRTFEK